MRGSACSENGDDRGISGHLQQVEDSGAPLDSELFSFIAKPSYPVRQPDAK